MSGENEIKKDETGVHRKQWTKLEGENSWTMFKVLAEFVDGFQYSVALELNQKIQITNWR